MVTLRPLYAPLSAEACAVTYLIRDCVELRTCLNFLNKTNFLSVVYAEARTSDVQPAA